MNDAGYDNTRKWSLLFICRISAEDYWQCKFLPITPSVFCSCNLEWSPLGARRWLDPCTLSILSLSAESANNDVNWCHSRPQSFWSSSLNAVRPSIYYLDCVTNFFQCRQALCGYLCVNKTSIHLIHLLYSRKHANTPFKGDDFCSLYWPRLNLSQWFRNNMLCIPLLISSATSLTLKRFFFSKRMLTYLKELTFYSQEENPSVWKNMGIWLTYPSLPRRERM